MEENTVKRVAEAIVDQGSAGYNTPSGPMITLLQELAARGNFREMSEAFSDYRKAHPRNAIYVAHRVPAMVSGQICRSMDIGSAFIEMTNKNPSWDKDIVASLGEADRFVATIEGIKADLLKAA
jgi:hypothetical protein